MKLDNVIEEKARIENLHEENRKRKNKLICSTLGIFGGFSIAAISFVFSLVTGGVLPIVLTIVGLLGGCAGVASQEHFNEEEAKVIDTLHDEYPFEVEKPALFPGFFENYAFNYTEKILEKINNAEKMEVTLAELSKLEENNIENVENNESEELKVDTIKVKTSIEKDDEIGE